MLNKKSGLPFAVVVLVSVLLLFASCRISLVQANGYTEYYLTVVSPYGVPVGEGWYYNDTYANASLSSDVVDHGNGTRRVFVSWNGDASGTNYLGSNPILMDQNKTAIATWKTQCLVTFDQSGLDSSAGGTVVTVNGTDRAFGELPYSFWVDSGTVLVYLYRDVFSSTMGKRFILVDVTGPASPATITGPTMIIGNYKVQYTLMVVTNPYGLIPQPVRSLPGETESANVWWYDAGTGVVLNALPVGGYTFVFWDVDGVSGGNGVNPVTVVMDSPHIATANYEVVPPAPVWPVGGYSASLTEEVSAFRMTAYLALVAFFGTVLGLSKRKRVLA